MLEYLRNATQINFYEQAYNQGEPTKPFLRKKLCKTDGCNTRLNIYRAKDFKYCSAHQLQGNIVDIDLKLDTQRINQHNRVKEHYAKV